jgi:hypothetical protein
VRQPGIRHSAHHLAFVATLTFNRTARRGCPNQSGAGTVGSLTRRNDHEARRASLGKKPTPTPQMRCIEGLAGRGRLPKVYSRPKRANVQLRQAPGGLHGGANPNPPPSSIPTRCSTEFILCQKEFLTGRFSCRISKAAQPSKSSCVLKYFRTDVVNTNILSENSERSLLRRKVC